MAYLFDGVPFARIPENEDSQCRAPKGGRDQGLFPRKRLSNRNPGIRTLFLGTDLETRFGDLALIELYARAGEYRSSFSRDVVNQIFSA